MSEVALEYADLPEKIKQDIRQRFVEDGYPFDDWWDATYDQIAEAGALLGLEFKKRSYKTAKGTQHLEWDFGFDLDRGASFDFKASYECRIEAPQLVRQEWPTDTALHAIADGLFMMQLTQRLKGLEYFTAHVESGRHVYEIHDWGIDEVGEPDEKKFRELIDDFESWALGLLQAEYDYLHSDEHLDEMLSGDGTEYDEEGNGGDAVQDG